MEITRNKMSFEELKQKVKNRLDETEVALIKLNNLRQNLIEFMDALESTDITF